MFESDATYVNILPQSEVIVYRYYLDPLTEEGEWIATEIDPIQYQFSIDRKFGAAVCNVAIPNPRGLYSYLNHESPINLVEEDYLPLIYWGNLIRVREGIYDTDTDTTTWYRKFYGIISSIEPHSTGTSDGQVIDIEAYDMIKILLDVIVEKPDWDDIDDTPYEADRIGPEIITMVRVELEDPIVEISEDEVGYVYRVPDEDRENYTITNPDGDKKYINWVKQPDPEIYVNDELQTSDYEIDFARGIIYFGYKKEEEDVVDANVYWYDMDTNRFEEVVADIIESAYEKTFGLEKFTGETCNWKPIMMVEESYQIVTMEDVYDPDTGTTALELAYAPDDQLNYDDDGELINQLISLDMSFPRATIQRTAYDAQSNTSSFDAIQGLLKYVNPSYRLYANTRGDFVGRYEVQKPSADVELELKTRIDTPIADNNVFTKVIAYGQRNTNYNIAPKSTVTFLDNDEIGKMYKRGLWDNSYTKIIHDSNVDNTVGWEGRSIGSVRDRLPHDAILIELPEAIKLGRIDILFGSSNGHGAVENMGVKVQVSPNGSDWYYANKGGQELQGTTSQWASVDQGQMDEVVTAMSVKYVKIIASSWSEPIRVLVNEWLFWAVKEIQIWSSDLIRQDATVLDIASEDPGFGEIPMSFALDLLQRMGTKTLVLSVNQSLTDEEMVLARAKDYLYEVCRNLNSARVEIVYSPHLEVGMTARITDNLLSLDRLYYIESIAYSMNGSQPNVSVELVSWD